MMTCTVHEPPKAPADRVERAETLLFVKEGFSWAAALAAPLWAIAHRLWLFLLIYMLIVSAAGLLLHSIDATESSAASALFLALHLAIGLEASQIQRWRLRRKGWRTLGSVNGRNMDECERRFLDDWLPSQPLIRVGALSPEASDAVAAYQPPPPSAPAAPASRWRSAFGLRRGEGQAS